MAWRRVTIFFLSCAVIGSQALACGEGDAADATDAGFGRPSGSSGRTPGGGQTSGGTFGESSSGGHSSGRISSSGDGGGTSGDAGESSSGQPGCDDPDDAPSDNPAGYTYVTVPYVAEQPGVLNGSDDVDWYGYEITGSPSTNLFVKENVPVELCVFVECLQGTLTLQCESGSTEAVDDYATPGCCATGDATSQAYLSTYQYCAGTDGGATPDDGTAYVRLTSTEDQCAAYTLRVGF